MTQDAAERAETSADGLVADFVFHHPFAADSERATLRRIATRRFAFAVSQARAEEREAIIHFFTFQLPPTHRWTAGEIEKNIRARTPDDAPVERKE